MFSKRALYEVFKGDQLTLLFISDKGKVIANQKVDSLTNVSIDIIESGTVVTGILLLNGDILFHFNPILSSHRVSKGQYIDLNYISADNTDIVIHDYPRGMQVLINDLNKHIYEVGGCDNFYDRIKDGKVSELLDTMWRNGLGFKIVRDKGDNTYE